MNETKTLLSLCAVCLLLLTHMIARGALGSEPECKTPTHCAIMSLARWHEDADEPEAEWNARALAHAEAVDAATEDKTERAWLIQTAWNESKFARFVDFDWDKCRLGVGGWCDKGRSFGAVQLQKTDRNLTRPQQYVLGLERFRQQANWCRVKGFDYWSGGTAAYGTGKACVWAGAPERVAMMRRIAGKL